MKFVGVTWDHPSGAALLVDSEIAAAVNEERYSRKKNDVRFPQSALDYVIQFGGGAKQISGAGIASLHPSYSGQLLQTTTFTLRDMVREQNEYWKPKLYGNEQVDMAKILADKQVHDQYPQSYWAKYDPEKEATYPEDSKGVLAEYLGIPIEKVVRVEHHLCHALYAYHGSPFRNEEALVVTIDGSGDGLNATVSIARNGKLARIYATNTCIIGRIYSHVTLLMGMKRLEHEYKVMGLAPYGNKSDAGDVFEIFNALIDVKGIEFVWKSKPQDSYFQFRDSLQGYRFDIIAAGMQQWVEDILSRWVVNLVKETGISTLVFSGGVSMNVKAMGVLSSLPEVERMYVPGSGADETTCIGAAIGAKLEMQGGELDQPVIVPSMYLGPDVDKGGIELVRQAAVTNPELLVLKSSDHITVAKLLARGLVIGRCIGRMEFGQRSLGNRAILADPTTPDLVNKINAMIKHRDFWMPFAPVLLDTYSKRYLDNPKDIQAPHMTIAFPTTDDGFNAMRASCHPADRTARAQILKKEDNPELYDLLLEFEKITGRGSLLNTSFNMHGSPIVYTAQDAYDVFLQTGLEGLWLEGLLVVKAGCRAQVESIL